MKPTKIAEPQGLQPRLQASGQVTDQVWERPRRPADPEPSRWRNVLPAGALLVIAAGAWFAFSAGRNDSESGQTAVNASEGAQAEDGAGEVSFSLLDTSWGVAIDAAPSREVHPPRPTPDELRERAFHKAAAERWKGVEIFVRRDR